MKHQNHSACPYPTILYQPADPRSLPTRYRASIGHNTSNPYSLFNLISRARQAGHAGRSGVARNTKLRPEIRRFDRKYKDFIEDTKFRLEIQSFYRKYEVCSEIQRCEGKYETLIGNTKM